MMCIDQLLGGLVWILLRCDSLAMGVRCSWCVVSENSIYKYCYIRITYYDSTTAS